MRTASALPVPAEPRTYLELTLAVPAGPVDVVLTGTASSLTGLRFGRVADHPLWLAGAEPAEGARAGGEPAGGEPAGGERAGGERAGRARARDASAGGVLGTAAHQLNEYAAGRRQTFDLPMDLAGTEFQLAVWRELLAIPYGRTTTYGAVALAIGRPGRARAVGAAVGANPIGVVVPCHRVIGANGALTGFAGGLANKVALLAREGVIAL